MPTAAGVPARAALPPAAGRRLGSAPAAPLLPFLVAWRYPPTPTALPALATRNDTRCAGRAPVPVRVFLALVLAVLVALFSIHAKHATTAQAS
jgi:hypothetical protein